VSCPSKGWGEGHDKQLGHAFCRSIMRALRSAIFDTWEERYQKEEF
jgi:hypothetical protein